MSDRSFLDTNIFVYVVDRVAPPQKSRRAAALIREVLTLQSGVISYQVIQEFINVTSKGRHAMNPTDVIEFIQTTLAPMLRVQSSLALFREALLLAGRYQISWYDALIVAAAIESRCTLLYSEDMQDGMKIGDLTIVNPFREDGAI